MPKKPAPETSHPLAAVELLELLPVDRDGELKATAELAVYEPTAELDTRAVYVITLDSYTTLCRFDRWEHRRKPEDDEHHSGSEWAGSKRFGQSGPSAASKNAADARYLQLVRMPGAERLQLAVDTAGSLTDAIYSAEQHESSMREAWQRLAAFKRGTDLLGFTQPKRDADGEI